MDDYGILNMYIYINTCTVHNGDGRGNIVISQYMIGKHSINGVVDTVGLGRDC